MNSTKERLHEIASPHLSNNERALLRCQLAREFEESGNYEAARESMDELWPSVGERPGVEGLEQAAIADVLLRVGALKGWIGSTRQIEGAQEIAKSLISESIRLFEAIEAKDKVAAAQTDLAVCYWREGAFDEARVLLQLALTRLADEDHDLRAVTMLRSAIVEGSAKRFHDALRISTEAASLVERGNDLVLKGKFHSFFGTLLRKLGEADERSDYIDRALIEYAAASYYFEQVGLSRYQGCVENNLGFLFGTIGKFREAHEHLDRAQALFTSLRNSAHLAQVDDTRARVLLAEGRIADAGKLVRAAVRTLEKGGEQSLLAEALTTHGIVLAHLNNHQQARAKLERAIDIAELAGDLESAGQAALTLVERLGIYLSHGDVLALMKRAFTLLEKTQDASTLRRLTACAFRALFLTDVISDPPDWLGFSLKQALLNYEGHVITLALRDSGGRVTQAANLLGTTHQNLTSLLTGRQKNLAHARRPIQRRKKGFTCNLATSNKLGLRESKSAETIRILHVEDDQAVAGTIRELLTLEGWEVEPCADGTTAMRTIASHTPYDLLLLDYELPGMNGVQLVQHARSLAHRRRIPVIILSATLDETAAHMAGADAFLRKPEDISAVTETVARLLRSTKGEPIE